VHSTYCHERITEWVGRIKFLLHWKCANVLFTKNYQNLDHACRNYRLSKLARFTRHSLVVGLNMCLSCTVNSMFDVKYCRDLGIWVSGHWRSLEMAPCDRSNTRSYLSSIVTMAIFCILYEIKSDIGLNFTYLLTFNLHDHLEPLRLSVQNFSTNCQAPKLLDAAKVLPKSLTRWVGRMNITDDRQTTDGRPMPSRTERSNVQLITGISQVRWKTKA